LPASVRAASTFPASVLPAESPMPATEVSPTVAASPGLSEAPEPLTRRILCGPVGVPLVPRSTVALLLPVLPVPMKMK